MMGLERLDPPGTPSARKREQDGKLAEHGCCQMNEPVRIIALGDIRDHSEIAAPAPQLALYV